MPRKTVTALLIDDDENVLAILRHFLTEQVPGLTVHTLKEPRVEPGYDIYLIDNDFGGRHVGARLATEARGLAPEALVLAYSSNLDRALLKRLLNAHCDGAFEKDSAAERSEMLGLIEAFAQARLRERGGMGNGPIAVLREMAGLFDSWNARLGEEERAVSGTKSIGTKSIGTERAAQ